MKIDNEFARKILEEETLEARSIQMKGAWVDRVRALGKECESKNRTMVAMLGTALLAKATNIRVDPYSLAVGEERNSNTYSARNLCKEVLAAEAARLGIDLGVTGREPLNNQPFFGKPRVSRDMKVRSDAEAALSILCDALDALDKVKTEKEARSALRAFLHVRERKKTTLEYEEGIGDTLSESDLISLIKEFVAANSEGGKRAQAVAAGLLDAMQGRDKIHVGRVNDPSRRMPGDVGILVEPKTRAYERVFEVRDKPITEQDLNNLLEKVLEAGLSKVGMLAVSKNQAPFDFKRAVTRAESRGVRLGVYWGWQSFIKEVLYWSHLSGLTVGPAYRFILSRLAELEISEDGILEWKSAVEI